MSSPTAPPLEPQEAETTCRLRFEVQGMDCNECAQHLQHTIGQLPGVVKVNVDFGSARLRAELLPGTDEAALHLAAKKIGYRLVGGNTAEQGDPYRLANIMLVVAVLLSGVGAVLRYLWPMLVASMICFLATIPLAGWRVFEQAWGSIKDKRLDMNVLMSLAALGAAGIGDYAEASSVVVLFGIGNWLQLMATERTRREVSRLLKAAPETALRLEPDGSTVSVQAEGMDVGQLFRVRAGDRLPLDGEVVSGRSELDQSTITGESQLMPVQPGSVVYAGSHNIGGQLDIRVTRGYEQTAIARIIQLMESSQESKAPVERMVDRFAAVYTPIVIGLALLVMLLPPLFAGGGWQEWFMRSLSMLLISCPCALVIGTPVAIVAAMGAASKFGALIKGGVVLETLAEVKAVVFDKTGTLTTGKMRVTRLVPRDGVTEQRLLQLAASAEEGSNHPLAEALRQEAVQRGVTLLPCHDNQVFHGLGVAAQSEFGELRVGRASFLKIRDEITKDSAVYVLLNDLNMGYIEIGDSPRPEARNAVSRLKRLGFSRLLMLTGDQRQGAEKIAKEIGISECKSGLLPEEKWSEVKKLREEVGRVVMVGDGVNDAPALKTADVGVAMAAIGSDIAIEVADIALMNDRIELLPRLILLSRDTRQIIRQNIIFAIGSKLVLLVFAAIGQVPLWAAVLGDSGVAVIVILNSLRLLSGSVRQDAPA